MKVLLLADIHSNWPALEAVIEAESFDVCFVAGDLVDYGADPMPCVDWCRQNARAVIRGNHDHAVAQRITPRDGSGFRALTAATRPLHWEQISPRRLKYLGRLPVTRYERIEFAGHAKTVHLVHGTPRDPLDEYLRNDPDAWAERVEEVDPGYVVVGHTHEPMRIDLDRHTVINPGSVGQPRDGIPGAAYAVIERGKLDFRRVGYDFDRVVRGLRQAGVADAAVELTAEVLRTGGAIGREEMDAYFSQTI